MWPLRSNPSEVPLGLGTGEERHAVGVILVTFYLRDATSALRLISNFCRSTGLACSHAAVVDNSGLLDANSDDTYQRYRVVEGDNRAWEFSGWLRGLAEVKHWNAPPVTVLLNDSFERNWSVTPLSRYQIRRMHATAVSGRVAAWLDNFSHLRPPRFSRRPNSRLVFLPTLDSGEVTASLEAAIVDLETRLTEGVPLFTNAEQSRIDHWIRSQPGRWASEAIPSRVHRIFLEHQMLNALPPGSIVWFPRTWFGSIIYGATRRLVGERR